MLDSRRNKWASNASSGIYLLASNIGKKQRMTCNHARYRYKHRLCGMCNWRRFPREEKQIVSLACCTSAAAAAAALLLCGFLESRIAERSQHLALQKVMLSIIDFNIFVLVLDSDTLFSLRGACVVIEQEILYWYLLLYCPVI